MRIKTLKDMDLSGKRVLLRLDLNVPVQDKKVTDTSRIDGVKKTITYLKESGAITLIVSHFGRPDGAHQSGLSLSFLLPVLQERWGTPVSFAQDCVGETAEKGVLALNPGDVMLLENVRFHKGEKSNDPQFTQKLAKLGDLYVNDAFSVSHRAHASTEGLAHSLPSAAGFLMLSELNALDQALESPQKPVTALVGGSKISTKINVLKNIVRKADYLVLGGAMATTFLFAQGGGVGDSLCETDMKQDALDILAYAETHGCRVILPLDSVCVQNLSPNAYSEVFDSKAVPGGFKSVDIGPKSVKQISNILKQSKTALWNGPLGVFEIPPFDSGTNAVASAVAELTRGGNLVSIAGGGDTMAALQNAGKAGGFTYVSTAGGAFLEWLEGKTLPGVKALMS